MKEALAQRQWYIIDAQGKVLGRMASEIAKILRVKKISLLLLPTPMPAIL
jgi:ribosomal protein L13